MFRSRIQWRPSTSQIPRQTRGHNNSPSPLHLSHVKKRQLDRIICRMHIDIHRDALADLGVSIFE